MVTQIAAKVVLVATLILMGSAPALAADEPDELVAGRSAIVVSMGTIKVTSDGPITLPNAMNDPTVEGATLRVFDTGVGGDDTTFALPAAGWTNNGMGFSYHGAETLDDPCGFVILSTTEIRIGCGKPITLTPPIAGNLGIILTAGTDSKRYCLSFGGTTLINVPGTFKARDAAAPAACETPPAPTPDVLVPGRVVVIQTGVRTRFVAKATGGAVFDMPPYPDANPALVGATLDIFDIGGGGGSNTYTMPAGPQWTLAGTSFKYAGAGEPGDPCRRIVIKKNLVRAVCISTDVTLNPPFTGNVGVRLTLGAGAHRYCAVFGGTSIANDPGYLKLKESPAPGACP